MNIQDLLRMAKSRVETAQKSLAEFGTKLQGPEALQAVEWGNGLFTAAGDLKVWQHVVNMVGNAADDASISNGVDIVLEELHTYAVHGASRIPTSSSFAGNRYDLECTRAYAEAYREVERRVRNAREREAARQEASGTPA